MYATIEITNNKFGQSKLKWVFEVHFGPNWGKIERLYGFCSFWSQKFEVYASNCQIFWIFQNGWQFQNKCQLEQVGAHGTPTIGPDGVHRQSITVSN